MPTLAHVLGIEMPSTGKLKGRVAKEALVGGAVAKAVPVKQDVSAAAGEMRTVLQYEELDGVRYYDHACLVKSSEKKDAAVSCP